MYNYDKSISNSGTQQQNCGPVSVTIQESRRNCNANQCVGSDCLFCSRVMLTSIITREFNIIFSGYVIYRQHLADSTSRRFSPKTGPLSNYKKSAYHLTSKFLYISTRYLQVGLISIRGMTPMQTTMEKGYIEYQRYWWEAGFTGRQVSEYQRCWMEAGFRMYN